MPFFPPEPEQSPFPEETAPTPRQPWTGPAEDELPALLPVSEVLAVTDNVAVALVGAHVHSDGVELLLERRMRRGDLSAEEWNRLTGVFFGHNHGMPDIGPLRYGLALGDGQRVLEGGAFGFSEDEPANPTIARTRGSGGGDQWSFSGSDGLWLWPLPPEGPIELVMQWPGMDIPESRVILDAAPILELAPHVRPLWG